MAKISLNLQKFTQERPVVLLWATLFLIGYWYFAYDGITFSDEVTYMQLGQQLWNNEAFVSDYHFTSRWGAFLFSGFFTHFFGFSDRYASLATLGFYLLTLFLVWKITPSHLRKWSCLFLLGQVYFLHFLTKVYPDGFLVFWVMLIPAASVFRDKHPLWTASLIVLAFFIGFCTKETIIFLFPFPLLLLLVDLRSKKSLTFYYCFFGVSLLVIVLYLLYYQWQFGDWLYRFKTVNQGHYISEYTYHDKGWESVLRRLTYLPFTTFIDRTYWLWLVLAIPGIHSGVTKQRKIGLEFSLCTLCLLIGFWFMTSTLEFYNPLYLNPRHLIVLIAPLAVCIAMGSEYWLNSKNWKKVLAALLLLGGSYAAIFGDWKIGLFYFIFAGLLFFPQKKPKFLLMAFCLFLQMTFSVYYQYKLKNYPLLLQTFQKEASLANDTSPLVSHDFIYVSRDILLRQPGVEVSLISMADMDSLMKNPPDALTLLIYDYYRHAYPAEREYLDQTKTWLNKNYQLISSAENQWLTVQRYRRK